TNPNTTSPTCNGPNSSLVGEDSIGGANVGRCFTLSALPDPNWQHYRWKVYMITVKLQNMRY
ncbi:MAG TPA: hypothetical protein VEI28_07240, partial [Thermodesulfovibrionales bacterium]|nr:hypothetical protein [Thermodesulfovibrionales bacterium]